MQKLLQVAINDLRITFKDNSIWINLLVIPAVLILVIGFVNGGFGGNGGTPVIRIDVLNNDVDAQGQPTELSRNLLESIRAVNDTLLLCPVDNNPEDVCQLSDVETLDQKTADQRVEGGTTSAVVVIPSGFADSVVSGERATVIYRSDEDPLQPSFLIQSVEAAVQRVGGAATAIEVSRQIYDTMSIDDAVAQEPFSDQVYDRAAAIWSDVASPVSYRLSAENTAQFTVDLSVIASGSDEISADRLIIDVIDNDETAQSEQFINFLDGVNVVVCQAGDDVSAACALDDASELDQETAQARLEAATTTAYVIIPEGFAEAVEVGGEVNLSGVVLERLLDTVNNRVEAAAIQVQPDADTAGVSGFSQSVPGMGSMYVMFTVLAGASLILEERKNWTLQRLAVMPVTRAQIIGGKMLARFTMGMIQYLVAFIIGFFLGVSFGNSPLGILLLMISFTLCMTAITFLLSTFVENDQQAAGLTTFFVLTTAPLGGAWWPLEIVPDFMQTLAFITPIGWAMEGFSEIIFFGGGVGNVLLPIGVLLGATVVFFSIAVTRFRYT
ncbi:MAG: ABC transporter permease [Chloroflexota bacterium]